MPSPFIAEIEIRPPHPTRCISGERRCRFQYGISCFIWDTALRYVAVDDGLFPLRCKSCLNAEREAKDEVEHG